MSKHLNLCLKSIFKFLFSKDFLEAFPSKMCVKPQSLGLHCETELSLQLLQSSHIMDE